MTAPKPILVTGATGFIGAHIVDNLLSRGMKVRGTTRSLAKGEAMIEARPKYKSQLEFVQIADFERSADFTKAVEGVGAIIHTASPLNYAATDNEKELVLPAIRGVRALLEAAAAHSDIRRIVITSSFASVLDASRNAPPFFTYNGDDWNPITYEESIDNSAPAFIAYRGSKKFAELEAWAFVQERKPFFDLVTLCPPMTFGPIVHPINNVDELNESSATLWGIAKGNKPLPVSRVPFWIDVRDLAKAHVEALMRPEAGGRRYVPASPERFSYAKAAQIMLDHFESLKGRVEADSQAIDESYGLDGETAAEELGLELHTFQETVTDLISQTLAMETNDQIKGLFKPKPFSDYDVDVKITACGVCGSDVHTVTGGWGNKNWPIVPGHEIIGEAVRVGPKVTTIKVGDRVGVGAQIYACLDCAICKEGNETYCKHQLDTYGATYPDGTLSQGGYSSHIRAHEHFTFPIPDGLDTELAAPMLCAGLTAYSPLVRNGVGPGKKVGIVGIGGIGHFGILFSKALGAETWAISRTDGKKADALAMGADGFLETRVDDWNKPHQMTFDVILSTASGDDGFDLSPYLSLLRVHGKFVAVGLPEGEGWKVKPQSLLGNGCFIGSSHLGSREETLDMLRLAVEKGIKSWVETIPVSEEGCGKALERVHKNDVKYRFTLTDYDKQFKN